MEIVLNWIIEPKITHEDKKRMMMLRICATIHPEKFREFQQAMEWFTTDNFSGRSETLYERIDDNNQVCLEGSWESQDELSAYLKSDRFQFLVGAMTVLGEISGSAIIHVDHQESLSL